jgi:hypothetical protein
MVTLRRSNPSAALIALAGLALVLQACLPGSAAGGNLHLRVSKAFDTRSVEESLWNSGTITADGVFPAAKLDSMDIGSEYSWDLLGTQPWMASTDQQMGDFIGDCNGGDCKPCTGTFGGSWEIASVNLTLHERGNGRYVFDLWLGSVSPPKVGGCDPMINTPVAWADPLTVTLTGIGSATAAGTADGYTIAVVQ